MAGIDCEELRFSCLSVGVFNLNVVKLEVFDDGNAAVAIGGYDC